jgi:8-oxo-dGTP diphosphatase
MERSVAGILVREGRVFVAKRGAEGSFSGYWEFPGGKVEPGESDQEALSREFLEEFGVAVKAQALLGETTFPHRGAERVLAAWLIELASGDEPRLIEHEELSWAGETELKALKLVDSDRKILPYILPLTPRHC